MEIKLVKISDQKNGKFDCFFKVAKIVDGVAVEKKGNHLIAFRPDMEESLVEYLINSLSKDFPAARELSLTVGQDEFDLIKAEVLSRFTDQAKSDYADYNASQG